MTLKHHFLSLFLITLAHLAVADDLSNVDQVESADQLVNAGGPDSLDRIYRGGDVSSGELDPWAIPSPDTSDSEILTDQMNPNPTVEYGEQLYGE